MRILRPLAAIDELASRGPGRLRAPLVTTTEALRRVAALRTLSYPMRRLVGQAAGSDRPLTCLLAMDDLSARYWSRTLFAGDPSEERLGRVAAVGIRRTADSLASSADVSLWRLPWPLARRGRGELLVPATIPMSMATDRPLDEIIRGESSGRASRKNEARRVRRLGLAVRESADPHDLERFHRDLYEPYTRARFGDLTMFVPAHMARHAHRQGWLLVLEREARPVAGVLFERWGAGVRILAFGVETDGPIPADVLLEACYHHAIDYAVRRGWPRLSLGTVRPVLTDGVLRYKRKWGARIDRPITWDLFLLRHADTPGARAALTAAPLVVERDGRLGALAGAEGLDAATQRTRVATPGIETVEILAGGDGDAAPTAVLVPSVA